MNIFKKKEDYRGIKDSDLSSWYIYNAEIPIFTNTLRFEFETV